MANLEFAPSAKKVTEPKVSTVAVDMAVSADRPTVITLNEKLLPTASIEYLLSYGLKQCLADSYSSAKDQAEFDAMLGKRIDKLIAGTMSIRESASPVDPFEAEVIRLAKIRLAAIAKKQGKTLPKVATDEYKTLLDRVRNGKAKDELETTAKKNLKASAALADAIDPDELDLSDL